MTDRSDRGTRRTAVANGAVAATLLVVLSAVALVAQPPSPPSIAEFAPQAQQQIEDAPAEQAAGSAGAAGSGPEREVIEVVESEEAVENARGSREPKIEGVPSALNCVSWPDGSVTQTFDPQSPPCIASWDVAAGNGGATARGVTAAEVVIGVPVAGYPTAPIPDYYTALAEHVNNSYQLYGRRLRLVAFDRTSTLDTPERQAQAAQDLAADGAFAALMDSWAARTQTFPDRLADQGIISVRATPGYTSSADMVSRWPYQWSYSPPLDQLLVALGEVVCKQLADRPAEHAIDYRNQTRTHAILHPSSLVGEPTPDLTPYLDTLAACGQADVVVGEYDGDPQSTDDEALIADLRLSGITTVAMVNDTTARSAHPGNFQSDAERAGYRPEWLVVGSGNGDSYAVGGGGPESTQVVFGLGHWNRDLPRVSQPSTQALAGSGVAADSYYDGIYRMFLVLASGIQTAGPELTPETFANGLEAATFPNPGAGRAPFHQASVGFTDGSPVMTNDFALVWGNHTTPNPERTTPGKFCFVQNAKRWHLGQFPTVDGFFDANTSIC